MAATERAEARISTLNDVKTEMARQDIKWGVQVHSPVEWIAILTEEVGEAAERSLDAHFDPHGDRDFSLKQLRGELVEVAAVAVQAIMDIDATRMAAS